MTVNILRSRHRNVSTKRPRKTPDLWHLEVSAWWVLFGVSTTLEPGAKLLSWRVGFGTGGIWNSFSARLEASAAMLRSFGNSEGRGDSINLWRAGRRVWQLAFCLLRWLFDAQRSQSNLQDLSNLSEIELHPQWPCGFGCFYLKSRNHNRSVKFCEPPRPRDITRLCSGLAKLRRLPRWFSNPPLGWGVGWRDESPSVEVAW